MVMQTSKKPEWDGGGMHEAVPELTLKDEGLHLVVSDPMACLLVED